MHLAIYDAPGQIEAIWRRLEAVARPPYALSWGWIETWLAALADPPPLAVVHGDDGEPLAAAFGDLPVLRSPAFPALGTSTDEVRVVVDREVTTPHVDLDIVRAVAGGYVATRPAGMRATLRHAQLHTGYLEIEAATDVARAHAVFDELLALNGAREQPMLRRLIDRRAPYGEVQLLRVRARDATLGCFYHVVWSDRIAYQLAGFASRADADLCHAAAIEYCAARGHVFYELHAGDERLATGHTRHVVLRLQRHAAGVSSKLAG